MARCKECTHYVVCGKEGRLVQIDEHTWDTYNQLDDVERFCVNHLAADVAPKSEVANEVIDDIEMYVLGIKSGKELIEKTTPKIYRLKRKDYMEAVLEYLAELKKKYTEGKE